DEELLRRMLLNLLDNAIKYTPAGGKMGVRSAGGNGFFRLSGEDSGLGISAELQSKIFERFFCRDKNRAAPDGNGGAGLWVATAPWIAGAHGGNLELTRSSSQGSLFTVTLPRVSS